MMVTMMMRYVWVVFALINGINSVIATTGARHGTHSARTSDEYRAGGRNSYTQQFSQDTYSSSAGNLAQNGMSVSGSSAINDGNSELQSDQKQISPFAKFTNIPFGTKLGISDDESDLEYDPEDRPHDSIFDLYKKTAELPVNYAGWGSYHPLRQIKTKAVGEQLQRAYPPISNQNEDNNWGYMMPSDQFARRMNAAHLTQQDDEYEVEELPPFDKRPVLKWLDENKANGIQDVPGLEYDRKVREEYANESEDSVKHRALSPLMSQDLGGFSDADQPQQVGGLNPRDSGSRFAPLDPNNAFNSQRQSDQAVPPLADHQSSQGQENHQLLSQGSEYRAAGGIDQTSQTPQLPRQTLKARMKVLGDKIRARVDPRRQYEEDTEMMRLLPQVDNRQNSYDAETATSNQVNSGNTQQQERTRIWGTNIRTPFRKKEGGYFNKRRMHMALWKAGLV
ncbi:hypothetical protein MP228_002264 [Amoeboaphelidium protococcarum]|nr:hypothetical protein MP228_002264 [Amoeboaphelidium protococcarum]